MFKLIVIVYIFTNVFTNVYDTMMVEKDAPIRNMKEFIENQQYREDQLRLHCKLNNFVIEPKKNIYETIYDDMKNYVKTNIEQNIYPVLYDTPIQCESYDDFIQKSQKNTNINRELEFNNMIFILINNNPTTWQLEIDNLQLEINDIRN